MIYSALTFENILAILNRDGRIRNSKTRNAIISCFFKKPHWTIDELYVDVKSKNETIAIQTVYNVVQLLLDKHILVSYSFDGKTTVYELYDSIAFHCYCEDEREVVHIDCSDELKQLLYDAVKAKGIECNHIQIKAIGKLKKSNK